ncbi:MAG: HAD family hydrolase [Alphaproteobacteria bacterium]|nr:HAD family hydrolase [Alphaproteobacteria bacterium]
MNAGEKIEAITAAAMQGKIDFREALHQRIRLLAGAPAVLLQDLAATMTFHTGAKTLFDTMKKNGAECWIVSGGFMYFIEKIGAQLGAHRCYGNELLMADDKVVGELLEPVLGREAKRDIYRRAQVELSISAADIVCVGDGANDLEMLMECQENNGLAVAYYAKPVVKEKISTHINHTDLTTILYAQGYVFDQFAHA